MNKPFQHHQPYKGCDLYLGDALEVLPVLAGEGLRADMVFTDPPYGTTHCRWDSVIDIPGMWQAVGSVTMPDTPILLFCQQPFTSELGSSNLKKLRYAWVWEKTLATGFLNARRMPMKAHEDILVFYDRLPLYNPIKSEGHKRKVIMAAHRKNAMPERFTGSMTTTGIIAPQNVIPAAYSDSRPTNNSRICIRPRNRSPFSNTSSESILMRTTWFWTLRWGAGAVLSRVEIPGDDSSALK